MRFGIGRGLGAGNRAGGAGEQAGRGRETLAVRAYVGIGEQCDCAGPRGADVAADARRERRTRAGQGKRGAERRAQTQGAGKSGRLDVGNGFSCHADAARGVDIAVLAYGRFDSRVVVGGGDGTAEAEGDADAGLQGLRFDAIGLRARRDLHVIHAHAG